MYWLPHKIGEFEVIFTDHLIAIDDTYDLNDPGVIEALQLAQKFLPIVRIYYGEFDSIKLYEREINWGAHSESVVAKLVAAFDELLDEFNALPDELPEHIRAIEPEARQALLTKRARRERKELKGRLKGNAGHVYLLRSSTGYYKIGRTKYPHDRLATFSVKLPFEVEYEHVILCSDMYKLERDLHNKFADKRVNGEWFELNADDVAYIKSLEDEHV